jgi:hypothetical protein
VLFFLFETHDLSNSCSFITDLDPFTIEALVTTASCTQAPALKNLLYNHLTGKASLGATIPVSIPSRNQGC